MREPDLSKARNRTEFERMVADCAAYFTVIRCYGRQERTREEFGTLDEALQSRKSWKGSKRPLIYAVTAAGRSCMLDEALIERLIETDKRRRRVSKNANQDDLIALAERIVAAAELTAEETGEEQRVLIPTVVVRALLELAKRAPKPRGRQQVSGREHVHKAVVLAQARSRKRELIAEGMPKRASHQQAAKEAAKKLKHRNIAASTMSRHMQRRPR